MYVYVYIYIIYTQHTYIIQILSNESQYAYKTFYARRIHFIPKKEDASIFDRHIFYRFSFLTIHILCVTRYIYVYIID